MTERQLEERLRRWHLEEADASPMPSTLRLALDQIAANRPIAGRPGLLPRYAVILVLVLLLIGAVAGAIAIGARVVLPDPSRLSLIDPATLDPCELLPGPGTWVGREPRRHRPGPAPVGGDSCAYGWDDGGNLHFQLRAQRTTEAQGRDIARDLLSSGGGRALGPLAVAGHPAWLGQAVSNGQECAVLAVSADPYFFVVWLTCRDNLPAAEDDAWDGFRERMVAVSGEALDNLDALNEGLPPPNRVELDRFGNLVY